MSEKYTTIYCNALLLDGKIINWKTGNRAWTNHGLRSFLASRQPQIVCKRSEEVEIVVQAFKARNSDEVNQAFTTKAAEFYSKYELHEEFPEHFFKPY